MVEKEKSQVRPAMTAFMIFAAKNVDEVCVRENILDRYDDNIRIPQILKLES